MTSSLSHVHLRVVQCTCRSFVAMHTFPCDDCRVRSPLAAQNIAECGAEHFLRYLVRAAAADLPTELPSLYQH